ncbi:MAG: FHIPEP family type III secretion protein, partial [Pseudomonadota bacterium]
ARGGATGSTDLAVFAQLSRYPAAVGTVAGLMLIFALFPGMPFLPFVAGAIALGFVAWRLRQSAHVAEALSDSEEREEPAPEPTLGDVIDLDEVHVEFAPDLVPMVLDSATGLDARIDNMRAHVATHFGVILPEIRLTDNAALTAGSYVIRIHGVVQGQDRLDPNRVLALLPTDGAQTLPAGEDVKEPVYGAPARWLSRSLADDAAMLGATVVNPSEVLATHLLEVIKSNLSRLVGMKALRRLLDALTTLSDADRAEANRRMIDDMIPDKVPMDLLLSIIRLLLEERVSIRNLPLILESIAEVRGATVTPDAICEHVRQKLAFQIIAEVRSSDGTVPLVQLAPEWEQTFAAYTLAEGGASDVALPPDVFQKLTGSVAEKLNTAGDAGHFPALVTSARRRRFLRTILGAKGISNPVLSFEELAGETRPSLIGLVPA